MIETNKIIKEYYKTGELEYEISFYYYEEEGRSKRIQHGIQKCYWPNGQLKETIPYVNGCIDGVMEGWYPDGRPRYKVIYEKSKKISMENYE